MINIILALVSGFLMVLAFPKFYLAFVAYVALVPLLLSLRRARSFVWAFALGVLFGASFISCYLYWINVLSKWAGFWTDLAWVGLFLSQSIFFGAFAVIYWKAREKFPKYMIAICPIAWALIEWIRSLGPYGVTGGDLCYSQTQYLPIIQLASFATCYGISFLVVLVNESLTELIAERKIKPLVISFIILLIVLAFGAWRISSYKETGRPVKISVVQANVSQDVKLDFGLAYEIEEMHDSISRKALAFKPDIIVWPETAITTYLLLSKHILASVVDLIRASHAFYLIGTPYRDNERIYNSVIAFSKTGDVIGRYDKQRLVPFGEYLPLRPLFFELLQENPLFAEDYNSNPHPKVLDLGIAKVGTVICFESTFPYLVRNKVKNGAQFILIATNDAWFFDSAAVYQHIQAAQMRAVESNRYVVQAANTGISAIIDPMGRIVKHTKVGEAAVLTGNVYIH